MCNSCPIGEDASHWKWNGPVPNNGKYKQRWNKVAKYPKFVRVIVQWWCGLRGHEISATEWGWGGGNVDCWCRWCNRFGSLKPETARFMFAQYEGWGRLVPIEAPIDE